MYVWVFCLHVYLCTTPMPGTVCRGQKRASNPLRQLRTTLWVLGIDARSFGRAVRALNHRAISPVPPAQLFHLRQLPTHLHNPVSLQSFVLLQCALLLSGKLLSSRLSWTPLLTLNVLSPSFQLCYPWSSFKCLGPQFSYLGSGYNWLLEVP